MDRTVPGLGFVNNVADRSLYRSRRAMGSSFTRMRRRRRTVHPNSRRNLLVARPSQNRPSLHQDLRMRQRIQDIVRATFVNNYSHNEVNHVTEHQDEKSGSVPSTQSTKDETLWPRTENQESSSSLPYRMFCYPPLKEQTPEWIQSQPSCAICLETFLCNEQLGKMFCHHLFHETCLLNWFQTSEKYGTVKCPNCRQLFMY